MQRCKEWCNRNQQHRYIGSNFELCFFPKDANKLYKCILDQWIMQNKMTLMHPCWLSIKKKLGRWGKDHPRGISHESWASSYINPCFEAQPTISPLHEGPPTTGRFIHADQGNQPVTFFNQPEIHSHGDSNPRPRVLLRSLQPLGYRPLCLLVVDQKLSKEG